MAGLEGLGVAASLAQLVCFARVVVQSYEKVFQNQATKQHIAKEIVKGVENLDALIQKWPDLVEAPDLVDLIMQFYRDLDQIQKQLDAAIPEKERSFAFKKQIRLWWNSSDIRSNLERVEKDIQGCYRRLLAATVIQTNITTHHVNLHLQQMQETIGALEKRVEGLVTSLQSDPQRAEEIIGIPSMTVPQMQTVLKRAATDLKDETISLPEKPFLIQKVELLEKALANHARNSLLPIQHDSCGQNAKTAEPDPPTNMHTSNVRRTALRTPCEDEEDAVLNTIRMTRALRTGGSGMEAGELGDSLRRLAHGLGSLGWREQALTVTEWEVQIYRRLAQDYPTAFEPKLSVSLNYLSLYLRDLAKESEALAAIEEAVKLSRKAAESDHIYRADLAMSLSKLSDRLTAIGRSDDALLVIKESEEIYRQLAEEQPQVYLPDLAMALNSSSNCLDARDPWLALRAIQESVDIRRKLVEADSESSVYLADLALSLSNLSNRWADFRLYQKAFQAAEESVNIYRRLAHLRPEVFLEDLASSLNNLSSCLVDLRRDDGALDAITEANATYQKLWQGRPAVFQIDFSMTLYNMSRQLWNAGRKEEAMQAAIRSVRLRQNTALDSPTMFLPKLTNSLNLLCEILVDVMGQNHGITSLPGLSMALQMLDEPLRQENEYDHILRVIQQAIGVYKALSQKYPAGAPPELTSLLSPTAISRMPIATLSGRLTIPACDDTFPLTTSPDFVSTYFTSISRPPSQAVGDTEACPVPSKEWIALKTLQAPWTSSPSPLPRRRSIAALEHSNPEGSRLTRTFSYPSAGAGHNERSNRS